MSQLELIEQTLKRTASRIRLERMWRALWQGILIGGAVWLASLGAYKLAPLPIYTVYAGALAGVVIVLIAMIVGGCRKMSLAETARFVDSRRQLKERLSTALEMSSSSADAAWKELVVSDAAQHASNIDPRQLLPLRLPSVARWALAVLVLGAGLGFIPEYRTKAYVEKKQEQANIKETGKQLAELTRQSLAQRPPALEPTQKSLESVAEAGEKLAKQTLTRSDALRDLASVTDKLGKESRQLEQNPAVKRMEKAARESNSGGLPSPSELQKQMQGLQNALGKTTSDPDKLDKLQRDLQKLQQSAANMPNKDSAGAQAAREQLAQALSELAKQAQEMGASLPGLEDAIKALQSDQTDLMLRDLELAMHDLEKMKEMAKAMQNLQQQMAKLGKDLAEQLKNGQAQAAQATLQKMMEQLKSSNLSQEQLQKLMDEVSKAIDPAQQYGKVGEHLKNASQQMQQGKKADAAQSLAQASQELDKLMQQMADAQSLRDALEALQRAQQAIAMNKNWSEAQGGKCSACSGEGCSKCKGRGWGHGGKPGSGVGTWAEETGWTYFPEHNEAVDNSGVTRPDMDPRGLTDRGEGEHNPNLLPTKVRGQMSPGGSMPSITLKGVSIPGQSSIQFEEAAAAAQSEAQSALNQDQVPRAYRSNVRDYFDDFKK
jgi:hypothetical protein